MHRLYSLQAVHTVKYSVQQSWLFLSKFKFMNTKKLVRYFVFLLGNKLKKTFSALIYFPKLFCFRTTKDLNILDRLTDWLKGITMQNLKWFNWVCPTVYSSLVCMHLICRLIMNNTVLKSITLSGFECSWLHP